MALSTTLSNAVDCDIQARGREYFTRGAVRIEHGNRHAVQATVQGTEEYDVTLERANKSIEAWCSCRYCRDLYDPCKHIWATLLAAEQRGYLGSSTGKAPRRLEVNEELSPEGLQEDEFYENDA